MSCSAPLFSYSRFRDNGDLEDPDGSSDVGTTVMIVVIVVVLVAAAACCWCFSNKSDGCGSGGCARAGGRVKTNGSADEATTKDDLNTTDVLVLMVYANWCGHCKTTMPNFKAAATKASVRFMILDADKFERELLGELDVKGFPHIVTLKNGKLVGTQYVGDRTEPSLLDYAASVQHL